MNHKDIAGKPNLNLLSYRALAAMAQVREYGINKYKSSDYSDVPEEQLATASIRHLYKHMQTELIDGESGLLHLAHAATSSMMALENLLASLDDINEVSN